jgi:hypothetical protein
VRALLIVVLFVAATGCGNNNNRPAFCDGLHDATPLSYPQPEGGLCRANTDCARGICRGITGPFGYAPRSTCGEFCSPATPCASGRACMLTPGYDGGMCVPTCANAGQCPSATVEEFCELVGDDAGTRACVAHTCNADADCGAGFECQNSDCGCPAGAQCVAAAPSALCRRK